MLQYPSILTEAFPEQESLAENTLYEPKPISNVHIGRYGPSGLGQNSSLRWPAGSNYPWLGGMNIGLSDTWVGLVRRL